MSRSAVVIALLLLCMVSTTTTWAKIQIVIKRADGTYTPMTPAEEAEQEKITQEALAKMDQLGIPRPTAPQTTTPMSTTTPTVQGNGLMDTIHRGATEMFNSVPMGGAGAAASNGDAGVTSLPNVPPPTSAGIPPTAPPVGDAQPPSSPPPDIRSSGPGRIPTSAGSSGSDGSEGSGATSGVAGGGTSFVADVPSAPAQPVDLDTLVRNAAPKTPPTADGIPLRHERSGSGESTAVANTSDDRSGDSQRSVPVLTAPTSLSPEGPVANGDTGAVSGPAWNGARILETSVGPAVPAPDLRGTSGVFYNGGKPKTVGTELAAIPSARVPSLDKGDSEVRTAKEAAKWGRFRRVLDQPILTSGDAQVSPPERLEVLRKPASLIPSTSQAGFISGRAGILAKFLSRLVRAFRGGDGHEGYSGKHRMAGLHEKLKLPAQLAHWLMPSLFAAAPTSAEEDEDPESMDRVIYIAAGSGVLGTLLLLSPVFFWFLYRRRRDKRSPVGLAKAASFVLALVVGAGATSSARAEGTAELSVVQAAKDLTINGEIFAGGDPVAERLETAREKLDHALRLIQSGYLTETLCTPGACNAGRSTCEAVKGMSPAQAKQCRTFVMENADALRAMDRVAFSLSPVPLRAPDLNGRQRPVSATTRYSKQGPVIFHHGSLRELSVERLVALIAHEIGHKISLQSGKHLTDNGSVVGFQDGRQFLDLMGAALTLYAADLGSRVQAPPPLPDGVSRAACDSLPESELRYLWGLAVDVESAAPTVDRLHFWKNALESLRKLGPLTANRTLAQRILSASEARGALVTHWFEKYWFRRPDTDELRLTVARLQSGLSYDAVLSSILGDDEYLKAHGIQAREQFLTSLYLDLLGRTPQPKELASLVEKTQGLDSPTVVQQFFRQSEEVAGHLVRGWYQHYLNRAPRDEERVAVVRQLIAGDSWDSVQAALLSSPEYITLQSLRWDHCQAPSAAWRSARK